MKKFVMSLLLFGFIAAGLVILPSYAGEIDILLQKLVEKGVLTGAEAQQIKVETKETIKKEIAAGESETLPSWVQTIKLKGDYRVRYQANHSKTVNDQTSERHRGRFRLRLGAEAKVNNKVLVALGLATGLSDNGGAAVNHDYIRSTNQSFDDSFSKHPINLDYAYAKYNAAKWLYLIGGKMKLGDVLWEPGDLMWDGDITPEGGAFDISKKINPGLGVFLKTGFYIFEEDS
ncbi:MAG: putative porin, partial [Candidatus Omnitrophica bacterium]|nr:putative porin [Candidatus Omnitrophota bacterium]